MWLHVCIVFGTGKNVAFVTKDPAYLNNKCFNFLFLLPLWHTCSMQAEKNYSKIRKQRKTIAEKCGVKLLVLNAKRDELLLKLPKTASQKVWSPYFSLNNMISLKWRETSERINYYHVQISMGHTVWQRRVFLCSSSFLCHLDSGFDFHLQ